MKKIEKEETSMASKPYQTGKLDFEDTSAFRNALCFGSYRLRGSQRAYLIVKQTFDVILGIVGFLLIMIPLLIVALLIKLDSKGPAVFLQSRVGKNGRIFKIFKFRTMHVDAPPAQATNDLDDGDRYVTRIGKILRKASIDELPQLINVIKGDMSLVGPRPLIKDEADMDYLRRVNGIYQLKPGITGLAQINGRDNVEVNEKIRYDREYLKTVGFITDIKILLQTIIVVIKGKDVEL